MEHICPICKQVTTLDNRGNNFQDYACRIDTDDHFYLYRTVENNLTQLKIRIPDEKGYRLYLKILYDQDRSEVWCKSNGERINIGQAFIPNFSDLDKLKNKIKLYLLLS